MKRAIRLLLINVAVTAILLASINLASNFILLAIGVVDDWRPKGSAANQGPKATRIYDLPNYAKERDLIRLYAREEGQQKTTYKPYVGWSHEPFDGKAVSVDQNGDRVHASEPMSDQSVFFFGGSGIWGMGAPNDGTIPALFGAISRMESHNKGEKGFIIRQGVARLVDLLAAGERIDIAIFYDGVNDVTEGCKPELQVGDHMLTDFYRNTIANRLEDMTGRRLTNKDPVHSLDRSEFMQYLDFAFLFGTRSLIATINDKVFSARTTRREHRARPVKRAVDEAFVCDSSPERARKVAESVLAHWEIAHDLARARGIEFLAILQPVAFIGSPRLEHLQVDEWHAERELQFKAVYPILRKIIRERGHPWILDYTDAFSRDDYIYLDFCHVSTNGNRIVAERMLRDIQAMYPGAYAPPTGGTLSRQTGGRIKEHSEN